MLLLNYFFSLGDLCNGVFNFYLICFICSVDFDLYYLMFNGGKIKYGYFVVEFVIVDECWYELFWLWDRK